MRLLLVHIAGGAFMLMPFVGALVQPIDPADDLAFKLRHPWRWCVRHPIIAAARRRRR